MAEPGFAGAVQVTVRLLAVAPEIVGADGADGTESASSTSVTATVTVWVWRSTPRLPTPLVAVTSTMYSLFSAASDGSS